MLGTSMTGEKNDVGKPAPASAGPGAPHPTPRAVHQLVERQAGQQPDTVAVVAGDGRLTYRELEHRANQLAHHLRQRGVGPETCVALCAERGLELAVGVLGILKAGAVYVPLDPQYPTARLKFMLADAAVTVLVTQNRLAHQLPSGAGGAVPVVHLDRDWDEIAHQRGQAPPCWSEPDNLTYILYTSGSTGQPKGVAMTHACLLNLLRWQGTESGATAGTTTLQFASISFDVAFQELFSTWSTGGTVIMITEDQRRDLRSLWRLIVEQGVQRVFLPPAVLTQLARLAPDMGLPSPALREVITAGEALAVDEHVRALFRATPACRLINQYGPTEAHVVTSFHLDGRPDDWPKSPPIGPPIAGVAAYVLSDRFRPVPAGTPGELHLGGVGLARGYLNRPGQTAERFVPDPFGRPGGRLYRTGDLVRQRGDGNLEFLGRIDRQVKLRGFRIEMGEIEAVLTEHEAVAAAVVALRHDLPGGAGLAAYVVPSSTSISVPLVRAYLSQRLPSHMVPVALVTVPAIPLTRNGKIDYDALPSPLRGDLAQAPDPAAERERPRTPVEMALAQCFSELLGLATVGVDESFFALGGHSLLATQLTSRVRDRFHVELPLRRVFENPTVATLAMAIVKQQAVLSRTEGGEMPPGDGGMPPRQGDTVAASRWDRSAWRRIAIKRTRKPDHR